MVCVENVFPYRFVVRNPVPLVTEGEIRIKIVVIVLCDIQYSIF